MEIYAGAAKEIPPFLVEAFVVEQDRDLLLDPEPVLREPRESIAALIQSAQKTPAKEAGTVIVTGDSVPYCFLAIVHDFTAEPSWNENWVSNALEAVFREVQARRLRSIGIPLLGTVHGKLARNRSVELLSDSLGRVQPTELENVWLLMPRDADEQLLLPLREAGYKVTHPRTTDAPDSPSRRALH